MTVYIACGADKCPLAQQPPSKNRSFARIGVSDRLIGMLFAAGLGSLFLALGLSTHRWISRLRSQGVTTEGRVIGQQTNQNGRYLVMRFTTEDGTETTTKIKTSGSIRQAHIGKSVQIVYDPERPKRASFPAQLNENTNTFATWFFIVTGSIGLAIALGLALGVT